MTRAKRWTRFAPVLVVVAALSSCTPGRVARDDASQPPHDQATAGARRTEPSFYELDLGLTDAAGRPRRLVEFRGRPLVVSMVYTSCQSVCPRVTADLRALDRALPEALRSRTRFVLFSLDPKRDTPAALAAFSRRHDLDSTRWTLLVSNEEDMRTLAAVLGVRFRPDEGGEIAHSAVISVVDAEGVIRHRQIGLTAETAPLVTAVRDADRAAPTAGRQTTTH